MLKLADIYSVQAANKFTHAAAYHWLECSDVTLIFTAEICVLAEKNLENVHINGII